MAPDSPQKPSLEDLQQAAQWYAVLQAHDVRERDRQRWRNWLAASALHRSAWAYVETVSRRVHPIAQEECSQFAVQTLIHRRARSHTRRKLLGGLGVLGLLGGWQAAQTAQGQAWVASLGAGQQTAIGDIQAITLPDGRQVWMDTATAMDTDFSESAPRLRLRTGAILIEPAANPDAGLQASAADWHMSAQPGSRFQTRYTSGEFRLAVHQGAVALTTPDGSRRQVPAGMLYTQAHQRAHASFGPLQPGSDAWARGIFHAQNIPLGQLVAELGRYRRGILRCHPEVAQLRVLGTYPLRRIDDALDLLGQALPVRIARRFPGWTEVVALG